MRENMGKENRKTLSETVLRGFSCCTQSRGRTGTGVTPLVFETSASTDSAIWAFGIVGKHCGAKVLKIYKYQNIIL